MFNTASVTASTSAGKWSDSGSSSALPSRAINVGWPIIMRWNACEPANDRMHAAALYTMACVCACV